MNKLGFLLEMNERLKHIPDKESKKLIKYYETYFLYGERQGKMEEDIIKELGEPVLLANEIIRHYSTGTKIPFTTKNVQYQKQNPALKQRSDMNFKRVVNLFFNVLPIILCLWGIWSSLIIIFVYAIFLPLIVLTDYLSNDYFSLPVFSLTIVISGFSIFGIRGLIFVFEKILKLTHSLIGSRNQVKVQKEKIKNYKNWYKTATVFILLGFIGISVAKFDFSNPNLIAFSEKWEISTEELHSIELNSYDTSYSVNFSKSMDEKVHINIEGYAEEEIIQQIEQSTVIGEVFIVDLTVDINTKFISIGYPSDILNVNVALPSSFELNSFTMKSEHGFIYINEALATLLDIEVIHGYVTITESEVTSTVVQSSSGNVKINNHTGFIKIKSLSGFIQVEQIAGDSIVSSTSGTIEVEQHSGSDLDISVTTGKVKAIKHESGNVKIVTTSGNVILTLPKDYAGSYNINTKFGNIPSRLSEHNTTSVRDSDVVYIQTTSGNISIR